MVSNAAGNAVDFLVDNTLLPLASIIVEPAKVLFLNNAINHGVLAPLGVQEVADEGKSILFMIETNPGPGLGLLLAYFFFGPRAVRPTVPGAIIIQFLGGIHEIYFPYVLMRPITIFGVIAGGMAGVFTLPRHGSRSGGDAIAWQYLRLRGRDPEGRHVRRPRGCLRVSPPSPSRSIPSS